jgi:hypothetical protein
MNKAAFNFEGGFSLLLPCSAFLAGEPAVQTGVIGMLANAMPQTADGDCRPAHEMRTTPHCSISNSFVHRPVDIPREYGRQSKERWVELCEQAAVEQDSGKLIILVQEIDRLLREKQNRLDKARLNEG